MLMHYQLPGFLHYDAVGYADGASWQAHSDVSQRIQEQLDNSPLASAFLTSEHTPDEMRRIALAQLETSRGVAAPQGNAEEAACCVESGGEDSDPPQFRHG